MTDAERLLEAVEKKAEPRLRAIRKRIEDGTATFADTAEYSRILSELLGRELSAVVLGFDDREGTAEALLRESYNDTNEVCAQVQTALDEKKGLHLAPQKAPFPAERVAQFAHSLVDPTVPDEKIQRRAKSGTENISMSFHDDFIEQNAEFRERAGLKCYVTRTSSGNCCPWCTAVAGKYLMSEQPEGLFRRHDNCDCVIVYDGQVLRGQKGENGRRKKKWVEDKAARIEFTESVPKPVVNSPEQAKVLENELMLASKPGKDDNAIADMKYINSQAFADKFKGKYENEAVEKAVVNACRQLVKNRNGTFYEEAFFIDAKTGKTVSYVKSKQKNGVNMPEDLKKHLTNAREKSIIMIHNHPNSSPLSTTDYLTSTKYASLSEVVACGHNGDVYAFRDTYNTQGELLGYITVDGKKVPYYESTRDFFIAHGKYSKNNADFEARHLAWRSTSGARGFYYEKR